MMWKQTNPGKCGEKDNYDENHDFSDELHCGEYHEDIDYEKEKQVQSSIREYLLDNGAYQTEGIGKKILVKTRIGFKFFR